MSNKPFNLSQELTVYLDSGEKNFAYTVTKIDFEARQVTVTDSAGAPGTFSFDMIAALGGITTNEGPEPAADDKALDLSDVPF